MTKVREITEYQKYCFQTLKSKNVPHLSTDNINYNINNPGCKDKQYAYQ